MAAPDEMVEQVILGPGKEGAVTGPGLGHASEEASERSALGLGVELKRSQKGSLGMAGGEPGLGQRT